jgi:hypothetical protein
MGVVTTTDIVNRFRSEVDDIIRGTGANADNDVLWKCGEVDGYLNEAVNQVATETLSLYKTFDIPYLAANGPYVRLPTGYEVLDIDVIYLVTARRLITERNAVDRIHHHNDYGYYGGEEGWEIATGKPRHFTRDFKMNQIRLWPAPAPDMDDTMQITAVIGAVDMQPGMPSPFQSPKDIRLILTWMKHLAYGKKDADTFDADATTRYKNDFENDAAKRKYECQRLRRAPSSVRFSW